MDPDVSDPSAKGTRPAATALPEPLDDPPDQQERPHGFRPGPNKDAAAVRYPPPPASSTIASFPISTDPVLSSFCSTVAVSSKICVAYGFAAHVVGCPANASKSLAPNGMPWIGPRKRSRLRSSSTCF